MAPAFVNEHLIAYPARNAFRTATSVYRAIAGHLTRPHGGCVQFVMQGTCTLEGMRGHRASTHTLTYLGCVQHLRLILWRCHLRPLALEHVWKVPYQQLGATLKQLRQQLWGLDVRVQGHLARGRGRLGGTGGNGIVLCGALSTAGLAAPGLGYQGPGPPGRWRLVGTVRITKFPHSTAGPAVPGPQYQGPGPPGGGGGGGRQV